MKIYEQKNWYKILPFVAFAYNTIKQETTDFTSFLLHVRAAEMTLDTMLPFSVDGVNHDYFANMIARAEEYNKGIWKHNKNILDVSTRSTEWPFMLREYPFAAPVRKESFWESFKKVFWTI